ncbi:hypothetical protein R1sor_025783 [Riccia sorocarpa]|uniref:Uncharacterized protein n=1 Tax=Riccia sorocarpa TaxID=122646 RepID=A0ABD3GCT7_9MARC
MITSPEGSPSLPELQPFNYQSKAFPKLLTQVPLKFRISWGQYQAECKTKFEDACVFRLPPFIRNLKPHHYNPTILPMGIYNRDFRKKTPMDELKLEIVSCFLGLLHIDHDRWNRFCKEVAHAESQVSGPEEAWIALKLQSLPTYSGFQLTATLYLPKMGFDDGSETQLLNLYAYEYNNPCNQKFDVKNFVCFMDELIDSEEDVDLLMRGNDPVIAYNLLGDKKKLANVFANLLQNYSCPNDERFSSIRTELITWSSVRWRCRLKEFLERFATTPWLLVSLIAATILLVLQSVLADCVMKVVKYR